MLTLTQRSLRRVVALLGALVGLLTAFQIALVAVAISFESRDDFAALVQLVPAFMREAFGPALTSFAGMTVLGYFEPLPVMVVVQLAIYLATEPAGDVEFGLVDLLLARAVPRHRLITRSLIVMTLCTLALTVTMGIGTVVALWSLAPDTVEWPAPRTVAMLMVHLASVGWCFGAIALAAAAFARRRGAALAPVAITAVGLYLLDVLGESWAAALPFSRFSPFHYFHGAAILLGTASIARDLAVLLGSGVIGVVLAYVKFSRRDI